MASKRSFKGQVIASSCPKCTRSRSRSIEILGLYCPLISKTTWHDNKFGKWRKMQSSVLSLRQCFWHSSSGCICTSAVSVSLQVESSASRSFLYPAHWRRSHHQTYPIHQITSRTCSRFQYFFMRSFYTCSSRNRWTQCMWTLHGFLLCFAHCIALSIAHSISSCFGSTSTYLPHSRCGSLRSAQPLFTLARRYVHARRSIITMFQRTVYRS